MKAFVPGDFADPIEARLIEDALEYADAYTQQDVSPGCTVTGRSQAGRNRRVNDVLSMAHSIANATKHHPVRAPVLGEAMANEPCTVRCKFCIGARSLGVLV